jgi:hypothetical protein
MSDNDGDAVLASLDANMVAEGEQSSVFIRQITEDTYTHNCSETRRKKKRKKRDESFLCLKHSESNAEKFTW